MLYIIDSINDPYIKFINDDPVRPNISISDRVGPLRKIFLEIEKDKPCAITCVMLKETVPVNEQELFSIKDAVTIAIFYTIWSYAPGAASKLLLDTVKLLKHEYNAKRFVTLSPKTEMAYKFHIKNGAKILNENANTINYEYYV
jgi:hypothetical protein